MTAMSSPNGDTALQARIQDLAPWYHRIEMGEGIVTPGDRNQGLVFHLFEPHLPDLRGKTVLDLGANACGLSIEFARRGAHVTAIEMGERYCQQAALVADHFGLSDRIVIERGDLYGLISKPRKKYDIVAYVGLSYHLRYPQLALDVISHFCGETLLTSTQTLPGTGLQMANRARHLRGRARGVLHGWEPTETLFLDMLAHAGFREPRLLSTAPHWGEKPGSLYGNRSYFMAQAASEPAPLPIDPDFVGKPEQVYVDRSKA